MSRTTTDGAGRTTRPALSRALIVTTALELLDRDGPEKLTMRRLGAELGADPMAVYHYFPSKAALFDAVVESVYAEIEAPEQPGAAPATDSPDAGRGDWRATALAYAHALRATLVRHPGALPAVSTRPVQGPHGLRLVELVLARLVAGGVRPGLALDLVTCVAYFTIGQALAQVGVPVGGEEPAEGAEVDLSEIPTMAAAFADGWEHDFDRQFDLALGLLLDGFQARFGRG